MFGWYVPTTYFVLFKSVLLKSFSKKKMFLTKNSNFDELFYDLNYLQMNQSFLLLTKRN